MPLDASNFKKGNINLTQLRIELIIQYVIYCYLEMQKDGKVYSKLSRGNLSFENYLRNRLVIDYLSRKEYKDFYKSNISDNPNVEIYFQNEEDHEYLNSKGSLSSDFIDISVKETELSKVLRTQTGDEIRFAIECKRIAAIKSCDNYISDIQKFTERPHTTFRLPFEGMIAFIENGKLPHSQISNEVSNKLKTIATIRTTQYLTQKIFNDSFDGSYVSSHKKNYNRKENFLIYHLLLDYSKNIKP